MTHEATQHLELEPLFELSRRLGVTQFGGCHCKLCWN